MEEITFEEMESRISGTCTYENSTAFRRAMHYIEENNPQLYKELVEIEYEEAFG